MKIVCEGCGAQILKSTLVESEICPFCGEKAEDAINFAPRSSGLSKVIEGGGFFVNMAINMSLIPALESYNMGKEVCNLFLYYKGGKNAKVDTSGTFLLIGSKSGLVTSNKGHFFFDKPDTDFLDIVEEAIDSNIIAFYAHFNGEKVKVAKPQKMKIAMEMSLNVWKHNLNFLQENKASQDMKSLGRVTLNDLPNHLVSNFSFWYNDLVSQLSELFRHHDILNKGIDLFIGLNVSSEQTPKKVFLYLFFIEGKVYLTNPTGKEFIIYDSERYLEETEQGIFLRNIIGINIDKKEECFGFYATLDNKKLSLNDSQYLIKALNNIINRKVSKSTRTLEL